MGQVGSSRPSRRIFRAVHPATVAGATLLLAASATALIAQSGSAPAPASTLPEGAGRALVERTCSQCHSLGLATSKRRTPEGWVQIVQQMIGMGAPLDAEGTGVVTAYLQQHYAEAGGMRPAAMPSAARVTTGPTRSFPRPEGANRWPGYGGGGANLNFSALTQIAPRNVRRLRQAWVYHYGAGLSEQGDQGLDSRFEGTPLVIGGLMYVSTPTTPLKPDLKSAVVALEPETGKVVWRFESPANIHGRGLAYWPGDAKTPPRLVFATDGGLIMAVDVTTGRPARGFGRNGVIDAYVGAASEVVGESRRSTFTISNPVIVYKDMIITGARPGEEGPPAPRGDIRAWDAHTGRLLWTFHTIPQPGEANHETWPGDSWRDTSGANVWSTMALDEANGILFAPVGDANSDAKGPQLYSDTILALDAATGKLRWFRQITHHDIWDWDLPTPPMLLDLPRDGKTVPAVLVTGKHGLVFLFDRLTGAPLNGLTEKPIPQPAVATEEVWKTQPFPDAPGPIARTTMTRQEIPDLVPGMRASCQAFWDENKIVSEPLYGTRSSPDHATITYPGPTGGPNWGGGSYNAALGLYFINMQNRATYQPRTEPGAGFAMMRRGVYGEDAPPPRPRGRRSGQPPFTFTVPGAGSLSCGATPWGELVALDVRSLKVAWRAPLGITPALGKAGLATGAPNLGGSLATGSGLVFIGATNDRRFRAFDARTGRKLWETELEASAHATPITFMGKDGKQYVVVAAGGGTSVGGPRTADDLVAYALP